MPLLSNWTPFLASFSFFSLFLSSFLICLLERIGSALGNMIVSRILTSYFIRSLLLFLLCARAFFQI